MMLAQMALKTDEARVAAALVDEALAASPTPARTRNAAGLMYLSTARYDQAIQHFRAGAELEPTTPVLWLNLGRAQLAMGQNEAARTSLQQALALQPGWLPAEGALVFLEVQQGNPGAARERIATLKGAHPREPGVLRARRRIQHFPAPVPGRRGRIRHGEFAAAARRARGARIPSAARRQTRRTVRATGALDRETSGRLRAARVARPRPTCARKCRARRRANTKPSSRPTRNTPSRSTTSPGCITSSVIRAPSSSRAAPARWLRSPPPSATRWAGSWSRPARSPRECRCCVRRWAGRT